MKILRFLAASIMTVSMVGCCCNRSCVVDSCDPCGAMPVRHCGLDTLLSWIPSCGWGCRSCGCGGCGCGGFGETYYDGGSSCGCSSGTCGGAMYGGTMGGSCCGGSMPSQPTMLNQAPGSMPYVPTPVPSQNSAPSPSASPTPASTMAIPAPAPPLLPASDSAASNNAMPSNTNVQHVTYEEFQRLPGTVISGPGVPGPSVSTDAQASNVATMPVATTPRPSTPSRRMASRTRGGAPVTALSSNITPAQYQAR